MRVKGQSYQSAYELEQELTKRFLFLNGNLKGVKVGSFGVRYASFHEYGTSWSARMPFGFWAAMKGRKQRGPSKNVMEFAGVGKNRIARLKARPFIRPAVETHRERIVQLFSEAISTNPQSMEQVLGRVGTILEAQIIRNIRRPPRPEKGARGPIANSGTLLNSIRYELIR